MPVLIDIGKKELRHIQNNVYWFLIFLNFHFFNFTCLSTFTDAAISAKKLNIQDGSAVLFMYN